jgi:ankyrin repeat protein
MTIIDRVRGSLYGLAVGELLGRSLEYANSPEGMCAAGPWIHGTALALALASAASDNQSSNNEAERYMHGWCLGYVMATGREIDWMTMTTALEHFKTTGDPFFTMRKRPDCVLESFAPFVLFHSSNSLDAIAWPADSISTGYHAFVEPDEVVISGLRYFAGLLVGAIHGESKAQLLSPRYCCVKGYWESHPLPPEIDTVALGSFKTEPCPGTNKRRSFVSCLETVLWAFYSTSDFESGCIKALRAKQEAIESDGADSNKVGALFGPLAGAFYGSSQIPWHGPIGQRPRLDKFSEQIVRWGWIERRPSEKKLYELNKRILLGDACAVQRAIEGVALNEPNCLGRAPIIQAVMAWADAASTIYRNYPVDVWFHAERSGSPPGTDDNYEAICKLLHVAGARFDIRDGMGRTVFAAADGNLAIISWLLAEGADPNLQDEDGKTALMYAARYRAPHGEELGRMLIAAGADVNVRDARRQTALMKVPCAVKDRGDCGLFQLLIDSGADIDAQDEDDYTTLMHAAARSSDSSVAVLLERKASLELRNRDGKTALGCTGDSEYEPYDTGCYFGSARRIVDLLLDSGAQLIPDQDYLLSRGARFQSLRLVQTALEAGVGSRALDEALLDAVSVAVDTDMEQTQEQIIELLLKAGANPNVRDRDGASALLTTWERDCVGDVALLRAGADANLANNEGKTPLMAAAERRAVWGGQSILHEAKQINVDQTDKDGRTALFYALENEQSEEIEVISNLLKAGADPHIRDAEGLTVLDVAVANGASEELIALLREAEQGSV